MYYESQGLKTQLKEDLTKIMKIYCLESTLKDFPSKNSSNLLED